MDSPAKDMVNVRLFGQQNSTILRMKIHFRLDHFTFQQHSTATIFSPSIKSSDLMSLSIPDLDGVWYMVLIPHIQSRREGEELSRAFVSLHLRRDSPSNKEVPTRFFLRILSEDGSVAYHRDCSKPVVFSGKGSGSVMWGWDRFISHDDLFNANNAYLVDDVLILEAEIQCLAQTRILSHRVSPHTECSTLKSDLREMYYSKDFCDFVLTASDGKELKAHRAILAARSEVFRAMLMHDTKERQTGKCKITDVDGQTMEVLLEYMYCDSIDSLAATVNDSRLAEEVLKASDKYRVSSLKVTCENQLVNDISQENAGRLLVLSDMHCLDRLKMEVLQFLGVGENLAAFMLDGVDVVKGYKPDLLKEVITGDGTGTLSKGQKK